jgi:hypothetical protein
MTPPEVLIVGAGFAGFHCARELERLLRPDEAELTLASPVDYMLYSPLLPQVAAGVITPQAAAVSLRRTLRRTLRAPCSITGIDLDARVCVAQAVTGEVHTVPWDYLVLCPGAVTRTFGTPGGEEHGRGMKTLAQATHLHDHVLAELELGNAVGDEQRRAAHCTLWWPEPATPGWRRRPRCTCSAAGCCPGSSTCGRSTFAGCWPTWPRTSCPNSAGSCRPPRWASSGSAASTCGWAPGSPRSPSPPCG